MGGLPTFAAPLANRSDAQVTDIRKGEPVWRETGDVHGVTLVASDAGLAAIGIEPDTAAAPEPASKRLAPREGAMQATLIAMLCAPDRATIEEIIAAT